MLKQTRGSKILSSRCSSTCWACVSNVYTHLLLHPVDVTVQYVYIPLSSSVSPGRLKCQCLLGFLWESPQSNVSVRHEVRGWEEGRYILISLSPYLQRYFLNNSASCKRSLFFILVAESRNPSPRPPKLRGLSKAKQTLKKKGSAESENG